MIRFLPGISFRLWMQSQHGNAENAGWFHCPKNSQKLLFAPIEIALIILIIVIITRTFLTIIIFLMILLIVMILLILMLMIIVLEPGWSGWRLDRWGPPHNCCRGKGCIMLCYHVYVDVDVGDDDVDE